MRTWGRSREASAVVRRADADNPQLPLHDVMQQRYELIRPLVLLQEGTANQRAQETDTMHIKLSTSRKLLWHYRVATPTVMPVSKELPDDDHTTGGPCHA